MNKKMKAFLKEEKGDFGVKQIAGTVGVIVIIGLVIAAIQGQIGTWVDQVWNIFIEQIEGLTS
ncbi:MAG: hypothetical protein ACLFMO_03640 [Eubacteriales bacterium]